MERNGYGLTADSGVDLSVRNTVAVRNYADNFSFRNLGTLSPVRAGVERSLAADSAGDGFHATNGARVTIRGSAAVRNNVGFDAHTAVMSPTEMVLDRCLASENVTGIFAGWSGFGDTLLTVSNSASERNTNTGIYAASIKATVRAFGNTITGNLFGMRLGTDGSMRSGGHNFVDGNGTDTSGTITSVPTI
jgi:hypothetical protein